MLINALYLDEDSLSNYIAALEGGLRESATFRDTGGSHLGGSLGWSGSRVEGSRNSASENTFSLSDHPAARLNRLIDAGKNHPDEAGWIDVTQPNLELAQAGSGAFVHWESDIYVPESLAVFSQQEEFTSAISMIQDVAPAAEKLGLDMEGLPDQDEMTAMQTFLSSVDVPPVVICEDSESDWRLVGALDPKWVTPNAELDARVRVIGKVKKRVPQGKWHPLTSLPGMNLVSRDERRRMEREGPRGEEDKDQFVEGPLLVVDYLALYS